MITEENKVAVLKRLREMLLRQKEKFQSYLSLLEQEESSIVGGDTERLLSQVELEKTIIAEIFTLKKVIAPLETLYTAAYPLSESTVPRLREALQDMGQELVARNGRNRALLKERMEELRREISTLRAWPRSASPFAEVVPSLVDITT
jgi:hypothetical protein